MNTKIVLAAVLAIIIVAVWAVNTHRNKGFRTVSSDEFAQIIGDTTAVQLLDVRTKEEYEEGHIAYALLDRVFYSLSSELRFKPAASVVVCRRGGASAAFDRLNKYFTMSNMPLVSSQYWNMAYGQTPGQVAQDEEGMQTMRTLARNMVWMIRKLNVSEEGYPKLESPLRTNFIR